MSENAFLVTCFAVMLVIVAAIVGFAVHNGIENAKFGAVCKYAGGKEHGDLCLKGDTVILRQDSYAK